MEDTTTVTETPSAPPPAPSSTPAAEPTPTTDRPSFGKALETFRSIEAQKKGPVVGAPAPAILTTDPTGTVPTQTPASKGPIPFEVHSKALENARTKTRADVETEFRTRYGEPAHVSEIMSWARQAATDRVGFLSNVIREALADPDLAPQVRSLAARTLGGGRQAPVPAANALPQPDFTDGQGNAFYSAKAMSGVIDYLKESLKADILGEVQPGLQEVNALKAEREAERQQTQLKTTMAGHLQRARAWPKFAEHEAEIKAALMQAPLTSGHPAEEALLLREIYDQVVGPTLSAIQHTDWLTHLQAQAHASSVNPAATGAPTGIPKTVRAREGGTMGNALKWAASQQTGR